MPVFRPLKTRPMLFGIGIPEFFTILLITGLGIALFFGLGTWTHQVTAPISQQDALTQLAELQTLQGAVTKAERLFATTGADTVAEIDLSDSDVEDYRRAIDLGISSNTTRDDLVKLIPDTSVHVQPVIPDPIRAILLIAAPFFLAVGFLIELSRGQNLKKDLCRLFSNARKQHVYITHPKTYLKENR